MTSEDAIKLTHESPFRDYLDLAFIAIADGCSTCRMPIQDKHRNASGALHGGAAFTMIDSGMGNALRSLLDDDEGCVTVETNISYINPASSGTLVCETKVLRRAKHLAFLESEIRLDGTLIAKASGTLGITKRQRSAKG